MKTFSHVMLYIKLWLFFLDQFFTEYLLRWVNNVFQIIIIIYLRVKWCLQYIKHCFNVFSSVQFSQSCLTPLSQWCHPTISSSVIPFSSCLQSFPASASFQTSQLFTSGGQSIGVSASTSVLPMNIQDWFPLGLTVWISFQSKGLSRVFSNTIVQEHQFFSTQLSLQSYSHIHTWLLEKP